jgi:D-isomer specific 2-hydroxyacid dehydrogenase, NAD binding domain
MKKHAVLVNTSRGTLVDSDALALALREEWIWGAGLDVVEGEPHVGADHPLVREPRYVYSYALPSLLPSFPNRPILSGWECITDHSGNRVFVDV